MEQIYDVLNELTKYKNIIYHIVAQFQRLISNSIFKDSIFKIWCSFKKSILT